MHYSLNYSDWFRDGHVTQGSLQMLFLGHILELRRERTSFLGGLEAEKK